jgi:hypothetical protein
MGVAINLPRSGKQLNAEDFGSKTAEINHNRHYLYPMAQGFISQ